MISPVVSATATDPVGMDIHDAKKIESGTVIGLGTAVAGTEAGSRIDAIEIGSRSENAAKTEIEN